VPKAKTGVKKPKVGGLKKGVVKRATKKGRVRRRSVKRMRGGARTPEELQAVANILASITLSASLAGGLWVGASYITPEQIRSVNAFLIALTDVGTSSVSVARANGVDASITVCRRLIDLIFSSETRALAPQFILPVAVVAGPRVLNFSPVGVATSAQATVVQAAGSCSTLFQRAVTTLQSAGAIVRNLPLVNDCITASNGLHSLTASAFYVLLSALDRLQDGATPLAEGLRRRLEVLMESLNREPAGNDASSAASSGSTIVSVASTATYISAVGLVEVAGVDAPERPAVEQLLPPVFDSQNTDGFDIPPFPDSQGVGSGASDDDVSPDGEPASKRARK